MEDVPAFTINQLASFVAVADTGTISAAATRLHISPSAVSAALTELERLVRAQLLHRMRAKGVVLTPTGELVLPRARLILHQAAELEADARGEGGVSGKVRVGCYPSLAPTLLPALMSSFLEAHAEVRLEIVEATQDQLTTALEAGALDVAIMYDLDLDPSLRRAPFAHLPPRVVLPGDHRLAKSERAVDLADLRDDPMVLLDAPPSAAHAMTCCQLAGFVPVIAYRARTYETARSFVGRGLGWTMLLQRPSADVTYEGRPVAVREIRNPELDPVSINVVVHGGTLLNRASRTFVDHVVRLGAEGTLLKET
ncbi:MAG: LysR substrate-binding domain-containing protein [Actinomycetota bacterium]|nr:LysR substrate-binding domain-containing protein [Actinomycetota bacterium]